MKKLILAMSFMMILTACSSNSASIKKAENEDAKLSVDKLTLTYVTSPLNVPSIIEKEKGLFSSELKDVEVVYSDITSGSEQSTALASGDVQFLHAIGGSSVVAAAASGLDIKIVNMYSRAPKAFALFSKDGSIKSAKDLVGKKIAGPMGTNLHELLVSYLKSENLSLNDVEFLNLSIPDAYAGLESGNIDVALLGGPAAYKAKQAGFNMVVDGEGYIEAIIAVATTQKYYDEHKDVIDKLIKVQSDIREEMKNNPEEVKKTVVEILGISEEAYDEMFSQYDFSMEVTQKDIDGLQKTADFMFESEMIKEKINASDLFIK